MKRRGNERNIWWTKTRGTLASQIRRWMAKCGWEETGEWKWKHKEDIEAGGKEMVIDLRTEDKEAVKHKAREAWRWLQWEKFRKAKRRDAELLREEKYDGEKVKKVRNIV